jgi:hypothetical protein
MGLQHSLDIVIPLQKFQAYPLFVKLISFNVNLL